MKSSNFSPLSRQIKLRLWETSLRNANYVHFPTLVEHKLASLDTQAFIAFIELLRWEFADSLISGLGEWNS